MPKHILTHQQPRLRNRRTRRHAPTLGIARHHPASQAPNIAAALAYAAPAPSTSTAWAQPSCQITVADMAGRQITTIEGLVADTSARRCG